MAGDARPKSGKLRWALVVLLLASGALWAFAFFWPKPAPGLPERFVGTWEVVRYEPPPDTRAANPLKPGERIRWEFDANGAYCQRILVGDYEIKRDEGVAEARDDLLVVRRVSQDRQHAPAPEIPWRTQWDGDHLVLTSIASGDSYWLARAE